MAMDFAQPEDEAPPGPGPWIVSFNDCMTNLLCFFVLLVSFSSFDANARARIVGNMRIQSSPSILPSDADITDTDVKPQERVFDLSEQGSERITDKTAPTVKPLAEPFVSSADAYKDRQVIYLDADRMFIAGSVAINGTEPALWVDAIADFMGRLSCQAVIREHRDGQPSDFSPDQRALTVVQLLVQRGVAARRFSLGSAGEPVPAQYRGRNVIEVTLLRKGLYQ
jgi:chemotaxis protein MotB